MKRLIVVLALAFIAVLVLVPAPVAAGGTTPPTISDAKNKGNEVCVSFTDTWTGISYTYCQYYRDNGKVAVGGGSYEDPWYSGVYHWMDNFVSGVYNSHSRSR